jgi:hypothetical protein
VVVVVDVVVDVDVVVVVVVAVRSPPVFSFLIASAIPPKTGGTYLPTNVAYTSSIAAT